jgi:hypothetical protein
MKLSFLPFVLCHSHPPEREWLQRDALYSSSLYCIQVGLTDGRNSSTNKLENVSKKPEAGSLDLAVKSVCWLTIKFASCSNFNIKFAMAPQIVWTNFSTTKCNEI